MQTITIDETSSSLRRILFVAELPAARNEIQSINLNDIGTADTFTLTYGAQVTTGITFAADMTTAIDGALEALSNIGAGNVSVAKQASLQVYDVTFTGTLASTDVTAITITSPVGFTPGVVTQTQHGGVIGAPARLLTFVAADIQISKNGATPVNSAGTVTEIGNGRYYYEATAAEVSAQGFLSLAVARNDVAVTFPTVQIVTASAALGAPVIRSGTLQAATSSSATLDTTASQVANFYVPALLYIRTNTGAGQSRMIYAYNGSTKVASIEPAWATTPDSTSVFDVLPVSPIMADILRVNHAAADTFGEVASPTDIANVVVPLILSDEAAFSGASIALIKSDTDDIQTRIPTALVGGKMSSDAEAIAGSTTAATTLKSHTLTVLTALMTTGSTTTAAALNTTTGINGDVPSASNDAYNGRVIVFITGALAGQSKTITDYVGATKTLTLESALTGAPASGDTAVIV